MARVVTHHQDRIQELQQRTTTFQQSATSAARENLGIALADRTMTSREIESGKLIMPFDILLDSQRAFYLVHNKNPMMTYGMRVFKEWVIDEVHNDIPE